MPWIRLLYLHPAHISDRLIELMADRDRILNYMDIPIQHINDGILSAMGRKIDRAGIVSLLERLTSRIEGLFCERASSSVFRVRETGSSTSWQILSRRAVFITSGYSGIPGRKQHGPRRFPDRVPKNAARKRRDTIMSVQRRYPTRTISSLVGGEAGRAGGTPVRGEGSHHSRGRFYGQAPEVDGIVAVSGACAAPGDIIRVRFTDAYPYDLVARAIR